MYINEGNKLYVNTETIKILAKPQQHVNIKVEKRYNYK